MAAALLQEAAHGVHVQPQGRCEHGMGGVCAQGARTSRQARTSLRNCVSCCLADASSTLTRANSDARSSACPRQVPRAAPAPCVCSQQLGAHWPSGARGQHKQHLTSTHPVFHEPHLRLERQHLRLHVLQLALDRGRAVGAALGADLRHRCAFGYTTSRPQHGHTAQPHRHTGTQPYRRAAAHPRHRVRSCAVKATQPHSRTRATRTRSHAPAARPATAPRP